MRKPVHFEGKRGLWNYTILGKRAPKKGEYYLSGAIVVAYIAPNNLSTEYYVVQPTIKA